MSSRNTPRKQSSSGTRNKKNTAKKGASRSRSNAKSASRSRQAREQVALEEERVHLLPDETRNDIAGVAIAIIAIALFIAVVSPGRAMLSSAVSDALLHGFGIGAYIVPFFLLAWAVSFFTRSNITGIWRTGLGLLLIVLSVISLTALFTPNADTLPTEVLFDNDVLVSRGGYVGSGVAWALITLVGRTIATVLLAGVIIAGLIIIGMSISSWFSRARTRTHEAMAREAYEAEQRRFEPDDFAGDGTIMFDSNGDVIPAGKAGRKGRGSKKRKADPMPDLPVFDDEQDVVLPSSETRMLPVPDLDVEAPVLDLGSAAADISFEYSEDGNSGQIAHAAPEPVVEEFFDDEYDRISEAAITGKPTRRGRNRKSIPTRATTRITNYDAIDGGFLDDEVELPDFLKEDEPAVDPGAKTVMFDEVKEDKPKPAKKAKPRPKTKKLDPVVSADTSGGKQDRIFVLPSPRLLKTSGAKSARGLRGSQRACEEMARSLQQTLEDFRLEAKVVGWVHGPSVTQFKIEMPTGVRVQKIMNLQDDIALALAAQSVRIFAPIPGTSYVGVEVPNTQQETVLFGDIIANIPDDAAPLTIAIGQDVEGRTITADLHKMPHLLVAGTTGSGKSVAINAMIMSMLMRATPDEVRMILVDPKRVEFSAYEGTPHLYVPVVTEPGAAASALQWGCVEMERRFKLIQKAGTRNIDHYNELVEKGKVDDPDAEKMPFLVIIIDELADLMMQCRKDVETSICRIAQLGRAAGIHLVVATQRPSTDIVTGLIKSNITNRMALSVGSSIDSRVILDNPGAEKLLGHGDMLLSLTAWPKPRRIQGCFTSEAEVRQVVDHLKSQGEPDYHEDILKMAQGTGYASGSGGGGGAEDDDPLVWEAAEAVISMGFGSTSGLQRRLKVGYARAGRIMDMLEAKGIVGPPDGTKPREVLVDEMELESLKAFELADEM